MSTAKLTKAQREVLEAVAAEGENAYGVPISDHLDMSLGRMYITLEELLQDGYVTSRFGEATPERGGRRKRYFQLTDAGRAAVEQLAPEGKE